MVLIVGYQMSPTWDNNPEVLVTTSGSDIVRVLIVMAIACSFFIQRKLNAVLNSPQKTTEPELWQQAKITLWYTGYLLTNEVLLFVAIYNGFILKDSDRFMLYGFACFVLQIFSVPKIALRLNKKPKAI